MNNQSGFGLAEILVALLLIVMAAMFGADLSSLAEKSTRYSDSKNEEAALSEAIYSRFKYSTTCDQSFGVTSGMNMQVTAANEAKMFSNVANGWQIKFMMPNLQAGAGMNLNVLDETLPAASRSIFPKKLILEKLRLANGVLTTSNATQKTYAADIYVQFSEIGGIPLKEKNIGTVIITSDLATGAIISCNGVSDTTIQSTCAQMGCTYIPGNPRPCRCFRSQIVCAAPGYFPVAFSQEGIPDCRPVGGSDCPAGQFLTEFGIDYISCAPSPVCPAGTANDGLGMAVTPPAPSLCKCMGATETWDSVISSCVVGSPLVCAGGATTAASAVPAAPAGCFCLATETWNGSVCVAAVPPPSCPAGTSTAGLGGVSSTAGCSCVNAGETWDALSATCSGSCTCPDQPATAGEYYTQCSPGVSNGAICEAPGQLKNSMGVSIGACDYGVLTCPLIGPPVGNQANVYLNAPFNPNYPKCGGVPIEAMNPYTEVDPITFAIRNYIPPFPAGSQCVEMSCPSSSMPCIDFAFTFFTGSVVITGGYQPAGSVTTFVVGSCEPSGTVLPSQAKSCNGPGTTAYCCGGTYTCSNFHIVCD